MSSYDDLSFKVDYELSLVALQSMELSEYTDKVVEKIDDYQKALQLVSDLRNTTERVVRASKNFEYIDPMNEINDMYIQARTNQDIKKVKETSKKLKNLNKKILNDVKKTKGSKMDNIKNNNENFSFDLMMGFRTLSTGLMAINTITMLSSKLGSFLKKGDLSTEQFKDFLIQIKESTDKFFKVKAEPELEVVKEKYRGVWQKFVEEEYNTTIDTLDHGELKKLYKRTRNLTNKIAKEADSVMKKAKKGKVANFSESELDRFDVYLEYYFSDNKEEMVKIAQSLYELSKFRMRKNYKDKDYKKAIQMVKSAFDKFFTTQGTAKIQAIKERYYPTYMNFINSYYNKAVGTTEDNLLFTIHTGFEKLGNALLNELKEFDKDGSISQYLANFSEAGIEMAMTEQEAKDKINNVKRQIKNILDIADKFFYQKDEMDNPTTQAFIEKHKANYEKIKNNSSGALNSDKPEVLQSVVTKLKDFTTEMATDASKSNIIVSFSEMLSRRNLVVNFSLVDARETLLNSFRLVVKEMPPKNDPEHKRFMESFIAIQDTFLGERVDLGKPEVLRSKIRLFNEAQLFEFNAALRGLLREIREYNNAKNKDDSQQNDDNNKNDGKNRYGDRGRGRRDDIDDSSKVKRFLRDMQKALLGPAGVAATFLTLTKVIEGVNKLKGKHFSDGVKNFSTISGIEVCYPVGLEFSDIVDFVDELKETQADFSHLSILADGTFYTY